MTDRGNEGKHTREVPKIIVGVTESRNGTGISAVEFAVLAAEVALLAKLGEGRVANQTLRYVQGIKMCKRLVKEPKV